MYSVLALDLKTKKPWRECLNIDSACNYSITSELLFLQIPTKPPIALGLLFFKYSILALDLKIKKPWRECLNIDLASNYSIPSELLIFQIRSNPPIALRLLFFKYSILAPDLKTKKALERLQQ